MVMIIHINDSALTELQKINFQSGEGIRIQTEQEHSCSLFTDYQLVVDQKTAEDEIIYSEEIPFIVSKTTKEILPAKIYLSYQQIGFKLYSDEEILKTNIRIMTKNIDNAFKDLLKH